MEERDHDGLLLQDLLEGAEENLAVLRISRAPRLLDQRVRLVGTTGATVTPEAAVLLPDGQMVYRGLIDDRFVDFGKVRTVPSQRDLEDVLQAIVEDRTIAATTTTAVECFIPELP